MSGIGNPEAFERTVRALGAEVHEHRAFGDHHPFAPDDLAGLGARPVVTTGKDAVKLASLAPSSSGGLELLVLDVELELLSGTAVLAALIDAVPPAAHRAVRDALHAGTHG